MTWEKLLSLQHTPKLLPDQKLKLEVFKLLCSLGHELGGSSEAVVHCRVCRAKELHVSTPPMIAGGSLSQADMHKI